MRRTAIFTLITAAALAAANGSDARAALVGYYGFENNANDSSGNNNNGVQVNAVSYSTDVASPLSGHSTRALNLDTNGEGITVATAGDARFDSQTFTVSFWVKNPGQTQGNGFNRTSSRTAYAFETAIGNTASAPASFYDGTWNSTSTGVVTSNVWTHIAYTHDQAANTMKIFVDGVEKYSGIKGASPSGNLGIGYAINGGNETFIGLMDDFAIYNEVLSNAQIGQLAAGASPLAVPEPASLGLAALALTGLALRRRRQA